MSAPLVGAPLEWLSWLLLAAALPCLVCAAVRIRALRLSLRHSEARFRSLTGMSSDFYWETDAEHRFSTREAPDRKPSPVSDFRQGAQLGKRRWEIPYLSPDEAGWRAHREMIEARLPFRHFELSRQGVDGSVRHMTVSGDPVFDAAGRFQGYRGVGSDITDLKLAQEGFQRLAHHDSLTGLPNRLLFNDRLGQAIVLSRRGSSPFALLYLDLDRFKRVNDAFGHATGDELLVAVAQRIRLQVRESDTVARLGGDEFAVVLPGIPRREEAALVAEKISAALGAPFDLEGGTQRVIIGASVGVAVFPADGGDAGALVRAADLAMFKGKQSAAPQDAPRRAAG